MTTSKNNNDTIELDITKNAHPKKIYIEGYIFIAGEEKVKDSKFLGCFFKWNSPLKTEMHHGQQQHSILNKYLESRRMS